MAAFEGIVEPLRCEALLWANHVCLHSVQTHSFAAMHLDVKPSRQNTIELQHRYPNKGE